MKYPLSRALLALINLFSYEEQMRMPNSALQSIGFWPLLGCVASCAVFATLTSHSKAEDYYPDHPVVQQMVDRAVTYIEKGTGTGTSLGDTIFSAIAVQKVRVDLQNPAVRAGLAAANTVVGRISRPQNEEHSIYEAAVAALLFCAADATVYKPQLEVLHDFLMRAQRPYGAFGYLSGAHGGSGDTSQVQYAVLALWTMDQYGIETEPERIEPLVRWLMQTQDPSGAWGYQGVVGRGNLVPQSEVRPTLAAAGLGSLLIGGDLLGFYRNRRAELEEEYIPKAFRRIIEKKEGDKRRKTDMQKEELEPTIQRGQKYFSDHPYSRIPTWHYYYLYSEERMQAFLEIANNKQVKSPAWYNRGVEQMRRDQSPEGGWGVLPNDKDYTDTRTSTAFAVLFLIRSTQKSIGVLNEGLARGGWSLPKDLSNIEDVDGKIIDRSKANSLDEVLMTLESEDASKSNDVVVSDKMKLEADPAKRREQLNRLGRLLSAKDVRARQAAAKLLGRGDDLELVPLLIYALGDGDRTVCLNAENSLRIVSRRLTTSYLPSVDDRHFTDPEKKKARDAWKSWYLTIRPDYNFVD